MSEGLKRVWVLGAGFSRHLGAPLFHELFQPGVGDRLLGAHLRQLDGSYARVFDVIAHIFDESGPTKGRLWSDAEQFLASVEQSDAIFEPILDLIQAALTQVAGAPKSLANKAGLPNTYASNGGPNQFIQDLSWWVKVLLALERDSFLLHRAKDMHSEYWLPYRNWEAQIR